MGIGLLGSLSFRTSFSGGLAFSTFSAGTIAGLADWFAVTALFRRPLGIRPGRILRTEIIPRNRERIFQSLIDIVEHLLSKEALLEKLNHHNLAKFLVDYFSEPQILDELNAVGQKLLDALDIDAFLQNLSLLSEQLLSDKGSEPLVKGWFNEILKKSREQGFDRQTVTYLSQHLQNLTLQPEVFTTLQQIIGDAYRTYESEHPARKWIDVLLPSPTELAEEMQKAIAEFLSGPEPVRLVQDWLDDQLRDDSPRLFMFFASLAEAPHPEECLSRPGLISSLRHSLQQSFSLGGVAIVRALLDQPERIDALDSFLKSSLGNFIDAHHSALCQTVRTKLDTLTDLELAQLIELKAGNDLQMIRINGSIVGGLAGMFIYLITTLL